MNEPIDPSMLIFAGLAIFVCWKLYTILGSGGSSQEQQPSPLNVVPEPLDGAPPAALSGEVVKGPYRWRGHAMEGSDLALGFDAIAAKDPSFDPKSFLDGSVAAYEMIVTAFAQANGDVLKSLLAPPVWDSFQKELVARKARDEVSGTRFVAMERAKITSATLNGQTALVTVQFESQLVNVVHKLDGSLVDGDPDKAVPHVDIWTFARDVMSPDPNWRLVATQAPV